MWEKHLGPPWNVSHVREWNKQEFLEYLRTQGLKPILHLKLLNKDCGFIKNWLKKLMGKRVNQAVVCTLQ